MILPAQPHHGYFYTNDSSPTAGMGVSVTSGAANTFGSWTEIGPATGLTYSSEWCQIELNSGFTAATTRNAYVDIGIGPDSANVQVVIEKLCGTGATTNSGRVYSIPVKLPSGQRLWARHQNTVATSTIKVGLSVMGGNQNRGSMPWCSKLACLGANTASTTGVAITVGASGAEGAWTQIVASSTDDYFGFLIGGPFCVDTNMATGPAYVFDVGIGPSGQERVIGENLTKASIFSASEDWVAWSFPTIVGVPAGTRLSVRGSCSGTAESTLSVVLYGFLH